MQMSPGSQRSLPPGILQPTPARTACQMLPGREWGGRRGPGAEDRVSTTSINPKEAPLLPGNEGTTWAAQPKARKESAAR